MNPKKNFKKAKMYNLNDDLYMSFDEKRISASVASKLEAALALPIPEKLGAAIFGHPLASTGQQMLRSIMRITRDISSDMWMPKSVFDGAINNMFAQGVMLGLGHQIMLGENNENKDTTEESHALDAARYQRGCSPKTFPQNVDIRGHQSSHIHSYDASDEESDKKQNK